MATGLSKNPETSSGSSTITCHFMAKHSVNQILSNAVFTKKLFDTEVSDIGGDYDTATSTFTAPVDGVYSFHARITYSVPASTSSFTICKIKISSIATIGQYANIYSIVQNSHSNRDQKIVSLTAGDTVSVEIYHAYGGNLTIKGGNEAWFEGVLLGAV